MPAVLLDFQQPLVQRVGRADLPFGDAFATEIGISATMPAPVFNLRVRPATRARIFAVMPAPVATITTAYDNAVIRGPSLGMRAPHQIAARGAVAGALAKHSDARKTKTIFEQPQQDSRLLPGTQAERWAATIRRPGIKNAAWEAGRDASSGARLNHGDLQHRPDQTGGGWRDGRARSAGTGAGHQERIRRHKTAQRIPWQVGAGRFIQPLAEWGVGERRQQLRGSDWQEGADRWGWGGPFNPFPPIEPPEPPCYDPAYGYLAIQFNQTLRPDRLQLRFACSPDGSGSAVVIPIREVYIVTNTVSIVTLPDRVDIPHSGIELAIDADSWAWTFSGTLPGSAIDQVMGSPGSPREIEVSINGTIWQFVIEQVRRSRTFGKSELQVRGRSFAAYLSDPYSAIASYGNSAGTMTAAQIAQDALPFGWSLNWQADDWLVPAGAFSHRGTPISVINTVGGAIAAQINAAKSGQEITVSKRYPVAPWGWAAATPDLTLPAAVVTQEGIEWQDRPDFNAVYVSGTTQGVLARVKRAGSAGDVLADMVTDPLMTAQEAAIQRGIAEIGKGGRVAIVSLTAPVIPADGLGIIDPGKLIQFTEPGSASWRGLVRGVRISASHPTVTQSIDVERHA